MAMFLFDYHFIFIDIRTIWFCICCSDISGLAYGVLVLIWDIIKIHFVWKQLCGKGM